MNIRSIVLLGVVATTDAFAAPVCSQGELFAGKADFDKDGNVYHSGTLQTVYVEKIGCK